MIFIILELLFLIFFLLLELNTLFISIFKIFYDKEIFYALYFVSFSLEQYSILLNRLTFQCCKLMVIYFSDLIPLKEIIFQN